jgi:hypothetical protein
MRRPWLIPAIFIFTPASFLPAQNLVQNPGLEGRLEPAWRQDISGPARAEIRVDTHVKHSGKQSVKFKKGTPAAIGVFARLYQRVAGLKPNTTYRFGGWFKGYGGGRSWIGGGTGWLIRKMLPDGDLDWQWVFMDYTTGPKETQFELNIFVETPTDSLWVDDIMMVELGKMTRPIFYEPRVEKKIPASLRFYPLCEHSPVVKVRSVSDSRFGVDVRISRDKEGLLLDLNVLDSTRDPVYEDYSMFASDSVQVGIDTRPEESKGGYTGDCYELGFALTSSGKVASYAWQAGTKSRFDFSLLKTTGERTQTGYGLRIGIPWQCLSIDPKRPIRTLGLNILVNDGSHGRRYVEWTPGIGQNKNPNEFARIDLPEGAADLVVVSPAGKKTPIGRFDFPRCPAGSAREISFILPACLLGEGRYQLGGNNGSLQVRAPIIRFNYKHQTAVLLTKSVEKFDRLKKTNLGSDPYVAMGLALSDRFIRRLQQKDLEKIQPMNWTWLQVNELGDVLDKTEKRLRLVTDTPSLVSPISYPRADTPAIIRDGIFFMDGKPFFFSGYVGWSSGYFPILRQLGSSLFQLEAASVWALGPEGKLNQDGRGIKKWLADGLAAGIRVDLTASTHYLPNWVWNEAPDIRLKQPVGFIGYNIDHPAVRRAIEHWLKILTAEVKDEKALFSIMLSNEPNYDQSGRDNYSRPLWTQYLKNRHGTIDKLNTLYEKKYRTFADVPVPPLGMPVKIFERRGYYDWVTFNQQHFADFHRWMNDIVKNEAPHIRTHFKLQSHHIYEQEKIPYGVDPELLCDITDLAGNDSHAMWPGGNWAYNWYTEECWYDLLHSYRGQPVFNSENHLIEDGDTKPIPAVHTRAVMWQGALHHVAANCNWVWNEADNPTLVGSIFFRPANIYEAGRTMLDLNRLAGEMARINQADPDVALLFSRSSFFWQGDHMDAVRKIYTALNFMGRKITFVSERQLAAGNFPKCQWIIVPHATHVTQAAVEGLQKFVGQGGRLILAGNDCLAWDEYHRPNRLPAQIACVSKIPVSGDEPTVARDLRKIFIDSGTCLTELRDAVSNQSVWGIEYRVVSANTRLLVPMINFLPKTQVVKIMLPGRAVDRLTDQPVDLNRLTLEPMTPLLLELRTGN